MGLCWGYISCIGVVGFYWGYRVMDLVIDLKVQPAKGKEALNYPFQFPTCLLECGGFSGYKFACEAGQTSEEMLIHKPNEEHRLLS